MQRLSVCEARTGDLSTYLQSRPDEAELAAIRMMLSLCRQYEFRLHIVHLATSLALEELRTARSAGTVGERRDLPPLPAPGGGNYCGRSDSVQVRAPDPGTRES